MKYLCLIVWQSLEVGQPGRRGHRALMPPTTTPQTSVCAPRAGVITRRPRTVGTPAPAPPSRSLTAQCTGLGAAGPRGLHAHRAAEWQWRRGGAHVATLPLLSAAESALAWTDMRCTATLTLRALVSSLQCCLSFLLNWWLYHITSNSVNVDIAHTYLLRSTLSLPKRISHVPCCLPISNRCSYKCFLAFLLSLLKGVAIWKTVLLLFFFLLGVVEKSLPDILVGYLQTVRFPKACGSPTY